MSVHSKVFMVRPKDFRANPETRASNSFQQDLAVTGNFLEEFDGLVQLLRTHGVEVLVFGDDGSRDTPDSIFPNNWISFHEIGTFLYPMMAENRRRERSTEILEFLKPHLISDRVVDLSAHESRGLFLEGTGSLVIDYEKRIVYVAISPRTSEILVNDWARMHGMTAITFRTANDIYHTNVLMTLGRNFAMLGTDQITENREKVISFLERSGKQVIHLSEKQISSFAGNAYELFNPKGESLILMSDTAYQSLDAMQIKTLSGFGTILHSPIPTIESLGGGSVRCMIADLNPDSRDFVI